MKKIKAYIYFGLVIMILSCHDNNQKLEYNFKSEIQKTLTEWKLESDIRVEVESDTLNIEILFLNKKNKDLEDNQNFYLDKASNQIIVFTLIQKFQEQMKNYSLLNIGLEFDDFPDIVSYSIDELEQNRIKKYFENQVFYDNVIFSLQNFNYTNLNLFKSSIKFISESSEKFNQTDDYWNLLNSFSIFCNNKNVDYIKDTELFILMVSYINGHNQFNEEEHKDVHENLKQIISNCGLDVNIINKNYQEIDSTLVEIAS